MRILKDVKELLTDEIKEIYTKGNITPTDLEMINKAVETIKDIEEICAMNDSDYEEGYSGCNNRRYYSGDYSGSRRNGRYSSYGRNYDRRYSRDGANTHMIEKLEDIMDSAPTNQEREIIKSCIDRLS